MNDHLMSLLYQVDSYLSLIKSISAKQSVALYGLGDGALGFIVSVIRQTTDSRFLIITPNQIRANRLAEDISHWLDKPCACMPPREINFTRGVSSRETAWKRLEAITAILSGEADVLCVPVETVMNPMTESSVFTSRVFSAAPGDKLVPQDMIKRLIEMGYERVDMVEGKGQFAVRGAILDVSVPSELNAFRFEFFDDEIDSVRAFDCISQRTIEMKKTATLIPASEVIIPQDISGHISDRLYKRSHDIGGQNNPPRPITGVPDLPNDDDEIPDFFSESYTGGTLSHSESETAEAEQTGGDVWQDQLRSNSDSYLAVAYQNTVTLLDWLPDMMIIIDQPDLVYEAAEGSMQAFRFEFSEALERGDAVPEQSEMLFPFDRVANEIKNRLFITVSEFLRGFGGIYPGNAIEMDIRGSRTYQSRVRELADDTASLIRDRFRVLLASGGVARGKRLQQSLSDHVPDIKLTENIIRFPLPGEALIVPLTFHKGFIWNEAKLAFITDNEVFGSGYRKARGRYNAGERIAVFTDLNIGDYIVHANHGIGVYKGTVRIKTEGAYRDYLYIQYQENDKLYVPTDQLDLVQRFIGTQESPPRLSKLGSGDWQRQKSKVRTGLKEIAFDLVKLYARRSVQKGFAFSKSTPWQRQFEDLFPYELTPDQQQSMMEIERDMETPLNMDRLLCGDVGYGKTEVALRASFKALMDSKQVAILAPTTILVQQHYHTIKKRFESFPVTCAMLSRFLTPGEQKSVLRSVSEGKVDIVVGTHRLLGSDVQFKDLGLLIVDEEQRFGVTHKEIIKNMKTVVDVLTLSATPIPRTLHMSMVGIRDMSLLETPPEERFPVKTYVIEYTDIVIRNIILREIGRGGQVFFLYNRVQSIEAFYNRMTALIPEARIGIAHGQMRENALEDIMMDFYDGSFDVLLCTTIIENGLDIPLANTLIVYDADKFGLSQLYQLRGRVGRSNRQAYAYFTVRPDKIMTESAHKRLTAIREFTEFGAGFRIAMRDLEIRGAGNILGPEQHGHLSAVGYDMYCKLLEEALREARGEKGIPLELETRVDLRVDAYLPGDYVSDERQRMEMYRRIASIKNLADMEDIQAELIDRFGDLSEPVLMLLDIALLRAYASQLGISKVSCNGGIMAMKFNESYAPDPMKLLNAILMTDKRLTLSAALPSSLLLKDLTKTQTELIRDAMCVLEKLIACIKSTDDPLPSQRTVNVDDK